MKKSWRIGVVTLAAALAAGSVWAHGYARPYYPRSTVQFGVYFGDPWLHPAYRYPVPVYWPPVYVAPPAPVVITQPPPVYIEQNVPPQPAAPSTPAAASLETGYWYYCAQSQAYYPYVKECPHGWQKVAPAPTK